MILYNIMFFVFISCMLAHVKYVVHTCFIVFCRLVLVKVKHCGWIAFSLMHTMPWGLFLSAKPHPISSGQGSCLMPLVWPSLCLCLRGDLDENFLDDKPNQDASHEAKYIGPYMSSGNGISLILPISDYMHAYIHTYMHTYTFIYVCTM